MTGIKRLVLDVLKPHQPNMIELAKAIAKLNHITGVNLSLYEIDSHSENIKITVEGNNIDYDELKDVIEDMGGAVHSVDEVAAGTKLIEEVETWQDR